MDNLASFRRFFPPVTSRGGGSVALSSCPAITCTRGSLWGFRSQPHPRNAPEFHTLPTPRGAWVLPVGAPVPTRALPPWGGGGGSDGSGGSNGSGSDGLSWQFNRYPLWTPGRPSFQPAVSLYTIKPWKRPAVVLGCGTCPIMT